jgi:EAL domain-containing protein (putative c-di-GMP-specific phosphodiesterase class I)/GGDEF domain-containing protein
MTFPGPDNDNGVMKGISHHLLNTSQARRFSIHPAVAIILAIVLIGAHLAPSASTLPDPVEARLGLVEQLVEPGADGDNITHILRESGQLNWQRMDERINRGYQNQAAWYRISIENRSDQPLTRYLEIAYPLLDSIEFHHVEGESIVISNLTGDNLAHGQRPLSQRTFVFPLAMNPGLDQHVYLRVETSGSHQVPLKLWKPEAFHEQDRRDMTSRGMFYGMLLIMALFNLFLWRAFGDRSFLYFVGVQFALLASMATLHGVTFMYLIPDLPGLHELIILVGVPLSVMFFCLFCREFLDLKQRSPRGEQLARLCTWLCAAATAGGLVMPYGLSTRISVNLIAIVCLLILAIGLARAVRGDRQGLYFVAGWFLLLLGVVGHILTLSGLLHSPFLMNFAMETGAVLASLVFSFALGDRFHRERQARIEEQQARLQALHERERVERRMLEQARRHAATGLPNRSALEQYLNQALSQPATRTERLALVLFRLRGFDDINKTLGHENADGLLGLIARQLDRLVGGMDRHLPLDGLGSPEQAVAHVEGYVFAFAVRLEPAEDPTPMMCQLADFVRKPVEYMGLRLSVGVNGACAVCPDDSADARTLLRHAMIAFDQAGRDVRGMAVYSAHANPYSARRLTLMTDLRRAIENDELELYFQPQMTLASGRVSATEALLRWPHPDHGMVPPDEFISLAERAGLMRPLTDWVITQALRFIRRLEESGHPIKVAINISPLSLRDPDFADHLLERIRQFEVPGQRLVIEVTESAAMADPEMTRVQLQKLKEAGIRVSIDDFGTGHSSLAYLSTLPVDEIKIDRSFVMNMLESSNNDTIVRTTIDMCHALGYEVVAEGVENRAIVDRLAELGADLIQGHYLLRAEPAEQVLDWLGKTFGPDRRAQHAAITIDIKKYARTSLKR